MKIDILCPSADHPVNKWLESWVAQKSSTHAARICRRLEDLQGGDLLFLISCSIIVGERYRGLYQNTIVIHASDLPKGRGWSPHVWEILGGADTITLSMLAAEDGIDTGAIWEKIKVFVPRHALYNEINELIFEAELRLMERALELIQLGNKPTPQVGAEATYYRKRTPSDSELATDRSLAELFDLMRVADPERYPAHFSMRGHTYEISLRKVKQDE